ncbi:MAG: phosphotransferase enzyme family protein [Isosphaeraceae bacterium]
MSVRGIDELLERYPRRYHPLAEPEFLGGAGGLSGSILWKFPAGDGLLVLRAWPTDGPIRAHLEQVHRWLARTAGLGFIPAPIPDRGGRTLQEYDGRFWELAAWLPGEPDRCRPPAPGRLRSAFAALAAFHESLAIERREGVSPGLVHRHQSIVQLIHGGFDTIEQAVGRAASGDDETRRQDAARRWIGLARIVAPRLLDPLREAAGRIAPLQPCLRDARPEHFLFEGNRVSGLVDFGAMGVDCVAGDLARLLGDWIDGDPMARSDALDAYERARPLQAVETALIGTFESSSALLIGEHWIRWHYLEGRRFVDPQATTRGIARGRELLERLEGRREPGRWIEGLDRSVSTRG